MLNKKGLSAVITTVIIIGIALVAVAIVFVVVQNLMTQSSSDIDFATKCRDVGLVITGVSCISNTGPDSQNCTVTVKRTAGNIAISGVKVVINNGASSEESTINTALAIGQTAQTSLSISGSAHVKQADAYVLIDSNGVAKACPQAFISRNIQY